MLTYLDKNDRNAIMHSCGKLIILKGLSKKNPSKNLPEEIIFHSIVQFLLMKGFEYYVIDNVNIKGRHASRIEGNLGQSLQSESIY
ncbi:MAG: hypothetical protein ACR5KW_04125 [Wolbachia sp.]